MKSRTLGYLIIVFTFLGLAGSTASLLMGQAEYGLAFYIINYIGDLVVLTGGIMLSTNNVKGRTFVYIGSVLFGTAGIISMFFSIIGGLVTVLISIAFILLARNIRFN